MSLQGNASSGIRIRPMITTIYGMGGIGKTTFGASFPKCVVLDLEEGSDHVPVYQRRDELTTLQKVKTELKDLLVKDHDFEALTLDSAEVLEGLMYEEMIATGMYKSLEEANKFSAGQKVTREWTREIMNLLKQLQKKRGMEIIIIAHEQVKTHNNPEGASYVRYTLGVNDHMSSVIRDLSDNVFFASPKVYTSKEGGRTKGFSDGQSVLRTSWRAAFDAKSRLNLPFELPLTYDAYIKAVRASKPQTLAELKVEISEMLSELDQEVRIKAQEATDKATTTDELQAIKNRIKELIQG